MRPMSSGASDETVSPGFAGTTRSTLIWMDWRSFAVSGRKLWTVRRHMGSKLSKRASDDMHSSR